MKVVSSTTYKALQTKAIAIKGKTYNLSYNKKEVVERDDGSRYYNLTLFYKKRKGVRVIKHYYTDLVHSFKVQLVVLKGKQHRTINDLDKISLFFKQYS